MDHDVPTGDARQRTFPRYMRAAALYLLIAADREGFSRFPQKSQMVIDSSTRQIIIRAKPGFDVPPLTAPQPPLQYQPLIEIEEEEQKPAATQAASATISAEVPPGYLFRTKHRKARSSGFNFNQLPTPGGLDGEPCSVSQSLQDLACERDLQTTPLATPHHAHGRGSSTIPSSDAVPLPKFKRSRRL